MNSFFFFFCCVGSLLVGTGFLQLQRAGATLCCGAWASHCSGFSCCGARALGTQASVVVASGLRSCSVRVLGCTGFSRCGSQAQYLSLAGCRTQAQQLWHMGLIAPRHVGSSWTRDQTRVPCIGRQILNHCATREVLYDEFYSSFICFSRLYFTTSFSISDI